MIFFNKINTLKNVAQRYIRALTLSFRQRQAPKRRTVAAGFPAQQGLRADPVLRAQSRTATRLCVDYRALITKEKIRK
ncbi:hypothetical protein [Chromobacterium sphagni]|uniref:hypothetical protein n=1 Tax=Chromobacterium sphagni TaxID=1903179 RepID=UPI001113EFFC|nr:hypothetical protein [Chromobacterium sphagni]